MVLRHSRDTTRRFVADEVTSAARYRVPELASFHVSRPRLLDTLAAAGSRPLVLVSAPAGTGKTSLVSEWVRGLGHTRYVGWVTFDDDADFWGPVWACLRRLGVALPDTPTASDDRLATSDLAALTHAIVAAPRPVILVIDGYQLSSVDLARDVDALLRHTYGRLQLVLLGRVDPVLPLYRYRLTGDLVEIRAADLAFTDREAAELLHHTVPDLRTRSVSELNERLSGWAAGLRFAALALADRDDPNRFVSSVTSQTTDIHEYLVGEVLDVATPEVRRFLLDTCVPDVLIPGLATELAGAGAVATLRGLAKGNAYVEPLHDRPECYRYAPFFRELLRARLRYESPRRHVELHHRAARWLERNGQPAQAAELLTRVAAREEAAARPAAPPGRLTPDAPPGPRARVPAQASPNPGERVDTTIVEPLTRKELEVLGHLEELLTTEEIAQRMYVSVNTVRTHVRSILRKLGVGRRNAAVRKARALGLVGDLAITRR